MQNLNTTHQRTNWCVTVFNQKFASSRANSEISHVVIILPDVESSIEWHRKIKTTITIQKNRI